jgi:hypothetical protein
MPSQESQGIVSPGSVVKNLKTLSRISWFAGLLPGKLGIPVLIGAWVWFWVLALLITH